MFLYWVLFLDGVAFSLPLFPSTSFSFHLSIAIIPGSGDGQKELFDVFLVLQVPVRCLCLYPYGCGLYLVSSMTFVS